MDSGVSLQKCHVITCTTGLFLMHKDVIHIYNKIPEKYIGIAFMVCLGVDVSCLFTHCVFY
jgi:hypothetical protein